MTTLDQVLLQFDVMLRGIPWHWVALLMHLVIAPFSALHAMLYKRDPRAALGWVSACLLFPLFGPVAYYLFGINRIRTQARRLLSPGPRHLHIGYERGLIGGNVVTNPTSMDTSLQKFANTADRLTSRPVAINNDVVMLCNGEQAFPAMLEAIAQAKHYILLISYLFESDVIGKQFAEALITAENRGVKVHVIVDGVGERYSWPRISKKLKRAGIAVASFIPPKLWPPSLSINLRNHRKLLVVDGAVAFTGGMNISDRHWYDSGSRKRTADVHFSIRGPVIEQLQVIFNEDWRFTTKQNLDFLKTPESTSGRACCRCISDGPNQDLDKIALALIGAISVAEKSIFIQTPYFLPSREMIVALQSAALRKVDVRIILPSKSNLRYVDWACRNLLWELLQYDVAIYFERPPFAHTKLFVVDGVYAQIGSANLDSRSLRLNFELNVELFSAEAVRPLTSYLERIQQRSEKTSLQNLDGRPFLTRVRDAACWLFAPYL